MPPNGLKVNFNCKSIIEPIVSVSTDHILTFPSRDVVINIED